MSIETAFFNALFDRKRPTIVGKSARFQIVVSTGIVGDRPFVTINRVDFDEKRVNFVGFW